MKISHQLFPAMRALLASASASAQPAIKVDVETPIIQGLQKLSPAAFMFVSSQVSTSRR